MDLNFAGGVRFSRALNIDTKIAYQWNVYSICVCVFARPSVWQLLSALNRKKRNWNIEWYQLKGNCLNWNQDSEAQFENPADISFFFLRNPNVWLSDDVSVHG